MNDNDAKEWMDQLLNEGEMRPVMSEEIKLFEKDYLDIPFSMMSQDDIIICFDPQKRLGEKTWSVVIYHGPESPEAKGLFWEKEDAITFAEKLLTADQRAKVLRLCDLLIRMFEVDDSDATECAWYCEMCDTKNDHAKGCDVLIAKQLKEKLSRE